MRVVNRLLSLSIISLFGMASVNSYAISDITRPHQITQTPTNNDIVESEESQNATSTGAGIPECVGTRTSTLQKSLLMMAFPRTNLTSSTAGDLGDAEYQIPALIADQLAQQHVSLAPHPMHEGLITLPATTDNLIAQQVQQLARAQRSQFVLSGNIVDMSMAHPDATYGAGIASRAANGVIDFINIKNPFDRRTRLFRFHLTLRDGFTGQSLFYREYSTYGVWGEPSRVGFGSPLFWKTDYGKNIKTLVNKASGDVATIIQCQPFIAQIDSRPGQAQVVLQGGANNGLATGDLLTLYQLVVQGSETEYGQHHVRLVNRNTEIELREVYPSHSVAVVTDASFLTGQFLAVVP